MAQVSKALIIGGGIAGLSAAVALARVGVQCDVVRLAEEAPPGASVSISGCAAETPDELGIYAERYANGTPFVDSSSLTQMDAAGHVTCADPSLPSGRGPRPPWASPGRYCSGPSPTPPPRPRPRRSRRS